MCECLFRWIYDWYCQNIVVDDFRSPELTLAKAAMSMAVGGTVCEPESRSPALARRMLNTIRAAPPNCRPVVPRPRMNWKKR